MQDEFVEKDCATFEDIVSGQLVKKPVMCNIKVSECTSNSEYYQIYLELDYVQGVKVKDDLI